MLKPSRCSPDEIRSSMAPTLVYSLTLALPYARAVSENDGSSLASCVMSKKPMPLRSGSYAVSLPL